MKSYLFSQLCKKSQERAYAMYRAALDDDLNRDSIVSFSDYRAISEYEQLYFNADGTAI